MEKKVTMRRKLICTLLAVSLLLCILAGCTSTDPQSSTPGNDPQSSDAPDESPAPTTDPDNPWAHLDLSQHETVSCYFIGNTGSDWERIVGMANELMLEKINTTVDFVQVPFADFLDKYALFLAGDESIDMLYAAPFLGFADHVKAGAFHGFDMEFIETYMPLSAKGEDPIAWTEATLDGMIYGVPRNNAFATGSGVYTTRDMMNKYSYTENDIKTREDAYKYFFDIAEGEKGTGIYPLNVPATFPSDDYFYAGANHFYSKGGGSPLWMIWEYDTGKDFDPEDMFWYADSPKFLEYALQMPEFNKASVFPADVMGNQTLLDDSFREGRSACNIGFLNYEQMENDLADRGQEMVYLDCFFTDESRPLLGGGYMGYAAVFPRASKKMERAAVALDCMKFDPDVHLLLVGGIEGEHYILDEATNTRTPGPNVEAYGWGTWNILIENTSDPTLKLPDHIKKYDDRYQSQVALAKDVFPLNGFNYDSAKYEAEVAVLSALFNEYRFSFGFGVFQEQTEAKYNQFMQECRIAGLDDIVADYKAQLTAYLAQ